MLHTWLSIPIPVIFTMSIAMNTDATITYITTTYSNEGGIAIYFNLFSLLLLLWLLLYW